VQISSRNASAHLPDFPVEPGQHQGRIRDRRKGSSMLDAKNNEASDSFPSTRSPVIEHLHFQNAIQPTHQGPLQHRPARLAALLHVRHCLMTHGRPLKPSWTRRPPINSPKRYAPRARGEKLTMSAEASMRLQITRQSDSLNPTWQYSHEIIFCSPLFFPSSTSVM
jgi:hypothetical protein